MGVPYLEGRNWTNWTREERFFCAVLYGHARRDPSALAVWVIEPANLDLPPEGEWDLGYEVSFYRDFLWPTEETARQRKYPKRTFDLCLFGQTSIVVIEAKVFERFAANQNSAFAKDAQLIGGLPGLESLQVRTVALASSKYFKNAGRYARPDALKVFDGVIKWSDLAALYGDDSLMLRADALYKMKKANLLTGNPV